MLTLELVIRTLDLSMDSQILVQKHEQQKKIKQLTLQIKKRLNIKVYYQGSGKTSKYQT